MLEVEQSLMEEPEKRLEEMESESHVEVAPRHLRNESSKNQEQREQRRGLGRRAYAFVARDPGKEVLHRCEYKGVGRASQLGLRARCGVWVAVKRGTRKHGRRASGLYGNHLPPTTSWEQPSTQCLQPTWKL